MRRKKFTKSAHVMLTEEDKKNLGELARENGFSSESEFLRYFIRQSAKELEAKKR